ncbi:MAG TPA: trigger factor, partial [Wolbachia sp.]|nr:trigger factor [Wolbachia sp.]
MSNNTSQGTAVVSSNDIYTYKELSIDKLKHEYEITVNGEHIKQKVDSELQKIAQTAKLPGFRVGKTPYELIIKNYQNTALESTLNDVLDYCSGDLMQKIKIESHIYPKIDVVSLPNLDAEDEKSSLVYKLSFESMPEVPVIDLDKINLKKLEVKVEEDDIKEYIDSIKVKFPNFVSVDDASYQAKSGDNLTIDFEGRIRGKLFKGGSSKNFSAKLGSNKFIGGFEDQLIGMKKGETKNFELQFPDNYQQFAGQKVDFFVQVNDIQVIKEFASDDDMAKDIGFKDYSSLMDHAKQVISDQCDKMTDLLMKKQLFDCLDVDYNFDIPTNVVY